MTAPLNPTGRNILSTLAEFRLLTASQLTTLLRLAGRTVRRQIVDLTGQGLIQTSRKDIGPVRC
ncbi:MAG TPA: helix-turn-helix transcriptional regulator [Phycisphaerae bacterium]|nr:helix-turn-helix transcriptional regulator [Phycisphaerae bacterium]HRY70438.1 helix-turn-helix transcriptional regulator [Phycisphaerae bacterium]HSA27672.1 helix-turn-helix transcriptional regulator [Phycisphaerae bacterium]